VIVNATVSVDELMAWSSTVVLGGALSGGVRNVVRRAVVGDDTVVVRRSSRCEAALDWELDLLDILADHGFIVPTAVRTTSGARHVDGVVVSRHIDGRPPRTDDDWHAVADELQRLHAVTAGWPQRPGFLAARQLLTAQRGGDVDLARMPAAGVQLVRDAWSALPEGPGAVVHGDPSSSNVRIVDGRVALLGWDEARGDHPWFDLADLPIRRLDRGDIVAACAAAHAWEAASAWALEPAYARWRLELLDSYRAAH
jgi:Ser/Thr protein kinase RdoA (MazF antagonist)